MRGSHSSRHLGRPFNGGKSIVPQQQFRLCRFPQTLLDHIGHSCDEFPIGGFAFFRTDGVAEIAVQGVPVPSGPGDFDQMADNPLRIPFIGMLVA